MTALQLERRLRCAVCPMTGPPAEATIEQQLECAGCILRQAGQRLGRTSSAIDRGGPDPLEEQTTKQIRVTMPAR